MAHRMKMPGLNRRIPANKKDRLPDDEDSFLRRCNKIEMRLSHIRKTTLLIAAFFLAAAAGTLDAATLLVPGGHKTIQAAVDAANAGDVIIVGAGAYRENVVIKKPLTLEAAKGTDAHPLPHPVITAADKTKPVISIIETQGVAITGLATTGSSEAGIYVWKSSDVTIKGNTSTENMSGITLIKSAGSTVAGNTTARNDNYGIYLEGSNGNTIEKNNASSNYDKGLFISNSSRNTITGNQANVNTWDGMRFWSSHKNVIKDNYTLRNTFGMVISDSNDNELSGNTSLPNIFIIYPILLVYIGIIFYLVQKNILKLLHKG